MKIYVNIFWFIEKLYDTPLFNTVIINSSIIKFSISQFTIYADEKLRKKKDFLYKTK